MITVFAPHGCQVDIATKFYQTMRPLYPCLSVKLLDCAMSASVIILTFGTTPFQMLLLQFQCYYEWFEHIVTECLINHCW